MKGEDHDLELLVSQVHSHIIEELLDQAWSEEATLLTVLQDEHFDEILFLVALSALLRVKHPLLHSGIELKLLVGDLKPEDTVLFDLFAAAFAARLRLLRKTKDFAGEAVVLNF